MLGFSVRWVFLGAKKLHSVPPARGRFPNSRQVMARSRRGLLIFRRRGPFLIPAVDLLLLVLGHRGSIWIGRGKWSSGSILSARRKRKHPYCKYNCRDHEKVPHVANPLSSINLLARCIQSTA